MNKARMIAWYKGSKLFSLIDNGISSYYRKRLKNDNFSIFCSNCIGGTVYHRFGKEFLSPTINMFMTNPDFVEFVSNLKYCLSVDPVFIKTDNPYPTAIICGGGLTRNITLHFNHDHSEEEAIEKWNRRKKRVNYDNLYLMMYNLDGLSMDEIRAVENLPDVQWKNKVIFTPKPLPEVDWSVYIEPVLTDHYPYAYLQKNVLGLRRMERNFDIIKFLNKC